MAQEPEKVKSPTRKNLEISAPVPIGFHVNNEDIPDLCFMKGEVSNRHFNT